MFFRSIFAPLKKNGFDASRDISSSVNLYSLKERRGFILRLLVERIDLSLGMAERAVVVDQADHLAIELEIDAAVEASALSESLVAPLDLACETAKFEAFEKRGPGRFNRSGILAPHRIFLV